MTEPFDRKIVAPAELARRLEADRRAGRTVVQCHGCFDIVHPGHVRYLRFARQLGDVLVVSLTGDQGVDKGPDRPYIPQELRAENLAALEFVDWVVIDPHPTAAELLELLKPDVYVKGREYALAMDPRFVREREIVERYGGRVVFHSGDVVFSSTRLLENVVGDHALDEDRLRAVCQRSGVDAERVHRMLAALSALRVVVVGDLVLERYVLCDADSVAEDAPALALHHLGSREYWGGAGAVAAQWRALGAQATLVTAIGQDPLSQQTLERLAAQGITLCVFPERPSVVLRSTFVADDGKLFELTEGDSCPLDSAGEKRVAEEVAARLDEADLLLCCDHGFGLLTPGLLQRITAEARRRDLCRAAHAPGARSQLANLADMDLLTSTERRVREALHDMTSGLPAVVWNLLTRTGGRAAVISLRKRGLIGFSRHAQDAEPTSGGRLQSEFVPTVNRVGLDWRGAEEAVLVLASGVLAGGGSLPLATYMATAAEHLAAGRLGGQPIRLAELRDWFHRRPELRPQSRFFPDSATVGDLALMAPPLTARCDDG